MAMIYDIGFINAGRSKRGAGVVRRTLKRIRDRLNKENGPAILFTAEIDEGDKGYNDHWLLKRLFPFWRRTHMKYRSPILLKHLRADQSADIKTADGVPRWSPHRYISRSRVRLAWGRHRKHRKAEQPVRVLGGHYPAGAYNGKRPAWAKKLLRRGYHRMLAIHKAEIEDAQTMNQHVIWGMDCNHRNFPRLHPREVQVAHNGPDYIRAVPLPGYRVKVHYRGEVQNDIERFHAGLVAGVSFEKVDD